MLWYLPAERMSGQRAVTAAHGARVDDSDIQQLDGLSPPPPANGDAARQVAQVAQHTAILDGALLACGIALVHAVRADKGEDALEGGFREAGEEGGRDASWPGLEAGGLRVVSWVVVVVGAKRRRAEGPIAVGPSAGLAEPVAAVRRGRLLAVGTAAEAAEARHPAVAAVAVAVAVAVVLLLVFPPEELHCARGCRGDPQGRRGNQRERKSRTNRVEVEWEPSASGRG